MARIIHKFRYRGTDRTTPSSCALCTEGGKWIVKAGAPELRAKPGEKVGEHHWQPENENGACWDGEKRKGQKPDPVKHVIVINPALWDDPPGMTDAFIHEVLHAIDHTERKRHTPGWWISHAMIKRVANALGRWMAENNIEFVKKVPVKHEHKKVIE